MNNFYKKSIAAVISLGVLCIGQVAVARINNPGGSGGAAQTPIAQNVDYASFNINSVGKIGIGTSTPTDYITLDSHNNDGIAFYGDGGNKYKLYHDGSDLVLDMGLSGGNSFKIEGAGLQTFDISPTGVSVQDLVIQGTCTGCTVGTQTPCTLR